MAVDLTPLLPSVNFSTTTIAVLSVAASIAGLLIAIRAYFFIAQIISGKVYFAGRLWDRKVYNRAMIDLHHSIRGGALVDRQSRNAYRRYTGIGTVSTRNRRF